MCTDRAQVGRGPQVRRIAGSRRDIAAELHGGHTMAEALEAATDLEQRLESLTAGSGLPKQPDTDWANAWLVQAYQRAWRGSAGS